MLPKTAGSSEHRAMCTPWLTRTGSGCAGMEDVRRCERAVLQSVYQRPDGPVINPPRSHSCGYTVRHHLAVDVQTHEMGQISTAISLSLQISISRGCLTRETLINTSAISSVHSAYETIRHLPMADPLRPKQYRVVQVHIRRITVAQRLACMEDERDLDTDLLLALHETREWFDVVDERSQRIFVPHEVEACRAAEVNAAYPSA